MCKGRLSADSWRYIQLVDLVDLVGRVEQGIDDTKNSSARIECILHVYVTL